MRKSSIPTFKNEISWQSIFLVKQTFFPRTAFTPLGLFYPPRFAREAKPTLGCKGHPWKKVSRPEKSFVWESHFLSRKRNIASKNEVSWGFFRHVQKLKIFFDSKPSQWMCYSISIHIFYIATKNMPRNSKKRHFLRQSFGALRNFIFCAIFKVEAFLESEWQPLQMVKSFLESISNDTPYFHHLSAKSPH